MRLKCKLVSVLLEIVLILTHGGCIVYAKRTIGLEIILDPLMELLGDLAHVESCFGTLKDGISIRAI
jgi:hypothetical protein